MRYVHDHVPVGGDAGHQDPERKLRPDTQSDRGLTLERAGELLLRERTPARHPSRAYQVSSDGWRLAPGLMSLVVSAPDRRPNDHLEYGCACHRHWLARSVGEHVRHVPGHVADGRGPVDVEHDTVVTPVLAHADQVERRAGDGVSSHLRAGSPAV